MRAVQGVSPACRAYANLCGQKGAPQRKAGSGISLEATLRKVGSVRKGSVCPPLVYKWFSLLSSSPPLPSSPPVLPSPILPSVSLFVSISLSFSRYFFSSSSFLNAFLEFKFIYKFTGLQVEQTGRVCFSNLLPPPLSVCFTLLAFLILIEVRGRERVKRTWRELYGTNQSIPKPLLSHL